MQNWVEIRHACSPKQAFDLLKNDIRSDIEARNKLNSANGDSFRFSINAQDDRAFRVFLDVENINREIWFHLSDKGLISAIGSNPKVAITGTVTLGDAGKCRLKVGDKELKFWQFRRRALEALFFGY